MQPVRKLAMITAVNNMDHNAAWIQSPIHGAQGSDRVIDMFQDGAGKDKVVSGIGPEEDFSGSGLAIMAFERGRIVLRINLRTDLGMPGQDSGIDNVLELWI